MSTAPKSVNHRLFFTIITDGTRLRNLRKFGQDLERELGQVVHKLTRKHLQLNAELNCFRES
jgi:hypothetical protein